MEKVKVVFVGAFVTAENEIVWGELELSEDGYKWLGIEVENVQNIYVPQFIDEKVRRHLSDASDSKVVVGDALTFKLSSGERLHFVPPHYNIALWLAAWEYSRSSHFLGISRNYAAVCDNGVMKKWQVRDKDGKIHNVRLHNLMCDCKDKIFSPRPTAGTGGVFLCPHILSVLAKLPKSVLLSHLDELQKAVFGKVVCSLTSGSEELQLDENEVNEWIEGKESSKSITVHFFREDNKLLSLLVERVDGDVLTVRFQWDDESTAPFRVQSGVMGDIISRLVSLLFAGKDISECHKDIVAYIAGQE